MRRREFITLVGGAMAAGPTGSYGQQEVMPVVGFLNGQSIEGFTAQLRGFHQGLKETGYVAGENVAIEYRWAAGQLDRLPELVAGLVRQRAAVIVTAGGGPPTFAAKAATTTIPIVFVFSEDPVRVGLVASLSRPGGNLTGINFLSAELTAKRLSLLRELVPNALHIAVLVNPTGSAADATLRDVQPAARDMGLQIQVLNASTSREIDAVFAIFERDRPGALFVGTDPFFVSRRTQLVHLASHYRIPASYAQREFAEAGGLMCYGANLVDAYRQAGVYTGRIVKGAKPVDLPVVQASKFELIINAQTARMLGLLVPPTMLALADEVIE